MARIRIDDLPPLQALTEAEMEELLGAGMLVNEYMLMGTLLVTGVTSGLVAMQKAMNNALVDTANAIQAVDPSYNIPGTKYTKGSGYARPNRPPITLDDQTTAQTQ